MILRAAGLVRTFPGPTRVLRGVDLAVAAGEVVTIAGRSGSGKSALLALLCGFDTPDAGTIDLLGRPLTRPAWTECAVLPQSLGLAEDLTLAENAALPARLANVPDRSPALLDRLGVADLGDRYPPEVSLGQRQRAALARALAVRPALLLADEPTAHLDHCTAPSVLAVLRSAADDGAAVLIATHHDSVHAIADRRLLLTDGVLVPGP